MFGLLTYFVLVLFSESRLLHGKVSHQRHGILWQPKYISKAHSDPNPHENENCLCYKNNVPSIREVLKISEVHKLKRLVVYLYKNVYSDTLYLYAPNKYRQVQFPDLELENGDDFFEVGSESVIQIFDSNQNSIDVQYPQNQDVNAQPEIPVEDNSINNDNPKDINEIQVETSTSQFVEPDNTDDTINNEKQENNDPEITTESADTNEQSEVYMDEHNSVTPDSPNINTHEETTTEDTNDAQPTVESSTDSVFDGPDLPFPIDSNNINVEPSTDESENNDSKNLLDQEQDPLSLSKSKSQLPTIAVEDYSGDGLVLNVNVGKHKQNEHQNGPEDNIIKDNTGSEYITFDVWFDQQMKKISKTGRAPNKNVDLSSLKNLIEKVLFENGFYVTKDGVLTDSKANLLSLSNLKLRRILIGESVGLNHIFGLNKKKYVLPSNLPYLDSVLVSLVRPHKILGVIPLGKTYVPRVSYRAGLDYWAWKIQNNLKSCTSWQCRLQSLRRLRQYYQSSSTTLTTNRHASSKKVHSNSKNYKTTSLYQSEDKHKSKKVSNSAHDIQYRLNLNKIFETLRSLVSNGSPNNRKADIRKESQSESEEPFAVVIKQNPVDEEEEVEELPGFRIIGGFPATSSGTPVSNKGRSGRLYH